MLTRALLALLTVPVVSLAAAAPAAAVPLQGTQIDLAAGWDGRIVSQVDNGYAGAPVGVGDVNGDGIGDLAFAERKANGDAGRVTVAFGGATPWDLVAPQTGGHGFVIDGRPGSRLGNVAAAGDVNGDGIADIVLGAMTDNMYGGNAGAAYVVFGQAAPTDLDLAALGSRGLVIHGDQDDYIGASVAGVGDLNGDGRADIAIGDYNAGPGAGSTAGEAYVVFGRAGTAPVDLHGPGFASQGFRIHDTTGTNNDQLGAQVTSAGDFNGDGVPDIGVWATSNTAPQYPSSAWVVFGRGPGAAVDVAAGGAVRIDVPTPAPPTRDPTVGPPYNAGDVNGDGRADVIVEVPSASTLGRDAGAAVVIYGRPGTTTINPLTLGGGGFRIEGAVSGDYMRPYGSSADLDGDGRRELLLGAATAGNRGRAASGSIWVLPAVPPPAGTDYDLLFGPPGSRQIDGAAAGDRLGTAAGLGDLNGDGRPDLGVGGTNIGGGNRGGGYLLLGFGTPAVHYGAISGLTGTPIAPLMPTGVERTGSATFTATGLPDGLAIDTATGVISGVPQMAATEPATVTMTDQAGAVSVAVPLSIAAAKTPPKPPVVRPKRFSVTTAFTVPSARRCLKRPVRLTLRYRRPKGFTVDRVEVLVGKQRLVRRSGKAARRSIALRKLPTRQFKLTIKVKPRGGKTAGLTRRYTVCRKR